MKRLKSLVVKSCLSLVGIFALSFVNPALAAAAESGGSSEDASHSVVHFGVVFAMFGVLLLAGKIGNFVERFGQPAVVGELAMGIVLAGLGYLGWGFIGDIRDSDIIAFIASFGALLLLFSIGLESNLTEMRRVGVSSLAVALIGVVVPFVLGAYILAPIFFADANTAAKLFLGAAMVATSVGLTASIFRSLGIMRTRAAQTVLGAAVIDDVLGLIVLAVVSSIAVGGVVTAGSISLIALESFGFLAGAIILGKVFAKPISKALSKIYRGIGMKLTFAVSFMLLFGYFAELFGLEPIIGAFAAGLVLDQVHFNKFSDPQIVHDLKGLELKSSKDKEAVLRVINKHRHMHVEDLISSLGLILIPVFFIYTGMQINFASLLQPNLYVIAGIISVVAVAGKIVSGFAAKGSMKEKMLVGSAMVPRGEVGLIFASTGKGLGVLSDEMFSVIVLVVVMTTFVAPPLIQRFAAALHPEKVEREVKVPSSQPKPATA